MSALPPEDWPNRAASRIVPVAPHRWHVQVLGDGPVTLLLHGAGASAHSWAPISPYLANQTHLLAIDLPGHGFTKSPRGRARLPDVARDVAQLLDNEGVRPHRIIAHSAGGAVALDMIRQGLIAPEQVVIVNGALEDFKGAAGVLFPAMARLLALNPLTGLFLSAGAQSTTQARSLIRSTGSDLPEELLRPYAKLIGMRSHIDGTLGMMAQWSLTELNRALPQVETRVLFLHGSKDSAVAPSVSERAASIMPNADLLVLEGLGHLAHEEAPAQVAEAIQAFASV